MVFIARSDILSRVEVADKVIKGRDFWAFSRAKKALMDANDEKDRIVGAACTAYEDEKKRGYREGVELAKLEQSANMIAIVSQTLDYFSKVEAQMVELVMEAVQKIASDFSDREKVIKVVRNSLTLVRNQKYITVVVHPSQSEGVIEGIRIIRSGFPAIENIDVVTDPKLDTDACVIESDVGRVEASMTGQIRALRSTFEKVFGTPAETANENASSVLMAEHE